MSSGAKWLRTRDVAKASSKASHGLWVFGAACVLGLFVWLFVVCGIKDGENT